MLKISKLIPEETIRCHIANRGIKEISGRCSGFTLGLAFSIIGDAMTNPNQVQSRMSRDISHAQSLQDMVIQVIRTSGLQFLTVKRNTARVFVEYKPFFTPKELKEIKSKVEEGAA